MQEAPEARISSILMPLLLPLMRPVHPSACATSSSSHWPGYNQALSELMRCIALSRICYGDHHWKMAEAHVNLAQGYLQFKGFSLQAQQHAEKVKEILLASSPIPSSDSEQRMDILKCSVATFHTLRRSLTALHKYSFSVLFRNLIKTQELLEELLQNDHILYQCQKRSEDAILCYQKALSYIERSKGEINLECIPVHKKMAGVAQVLGDHATAIQHLVKAHFIALRKSPSSGEAAETAHLVAQAAVASKQSEHKGECLLKYFQESMNAFKEAEGLESAKCLGAVDDFCQFLIATGQQEVRNFGRSLSKISLFGYLSLEVAETYWLLGGTELAQGHTHLAYKKLKKCFPNLGRRLCRESPWWAGLVCLPAMSAGSADCVSQWPQFAAPGQWELLEGVQAEECTGATIPMHILY
uniref:Tetratricopeptide repeat domain 23 n=1 Tax=Chelonoidis abingdonii TaxID=106734 RepID=A0A8C0J7Z0_CHEAB